MAARILVVDDEPMVRALIVRALTDEGYTLQWPMAVLRWTRPAEPTADSA